MKTELVPPQSTEGEVGYIDIVNHLARKPKGWTWPGAHPPADAGLRDLEHGQLEREIAQMEGEFSAREALAKLQERFRVALPSVLKALMRMAEKRVLTPTGTRIVDGKVCKLYRRRAGA